jgi:hypothetical protein
MDQARRNGEFGVDKSRVAEGSFRVVAHSLVIGSIGRKDALKDAGRVAAHRVSCTSTSGDFSGNV